MNVQLAIGVAAAVDALPQDLDLPFEAAPQLVRRARSLFSRRSSVAIDFVQVRQAALPLGSPSTFAIVWRATSSRRYIQVSRPRPSCCASRPAGGESVVLVWRSRIERQRSAIA